MMRAAAFALCLLAAPAVAGDHPGDIAITGAAAHSGAVAYDAIRAMSSVTVTVSQQAGGGPSAGTFTGVLLWTLVRNASPIDAPGKNTWLRHTYMVTGVDGYAAAISQGEIDPRLEGKLVILAWSKDGQPLAAAELVVPGDAHAARRVHDVAGIEVR
jgi:hypothetical protein